MMFRYIQNLKPQKYLVEKFVQDVKATPEKYSVPAKIGTGTNLPTIDSTCKDFLGENVVITDGVGILGKHLAIKLGRLNANVALWGDHAQALEETANLVRLVGGKVMVYLGDICNRQDIYRMADNTKRDLGEVSIVINNTDFACEKLLLDTPDYLIEKAFDANVMSNFWVTKAFLPNMIDSGRGHIVSIASMAGFMGVQKLTDYCSSKSAAMGFLNALRIELEREASGVRTTVVCPYFIKDTTLPNKPKLRIIKAVEPDYVADKTIEAIKNKSVMVFIPGWLRYAMLPRWITPSIVTSYLTKLLVKDPSPTETVETYNPVKIVQFMRSVGPLVAKTVDKNEKSK